MTEFEAHFAALRERFKARLGERLGSLRAARHELGTSGGEGAVATIRALAHDLAGSSGTFGYPDIGTASAVLEEAADRAVAGSGPCSELLSPLYALGARIEAAIADPTPA